MFKKSYAGQLIVANPLNPKDSLHHSVILVIAHSTDFSMGLQINRPILDFSLVDIGHQMDIFLDSREPIYYGGRVNPNKIHVIHSNDWSGLTTKSLTSELSVTSDISVLTALCQNQGPELFKACAGFWAWEGGQLEQQLESKGSNTDHKWESVPAGLDNVFDYGDTIDHWHRVIEDAARHRTSSWFNLSLG